MKSHSVDITGRPIHVGDTVDYAYDGDEPNPFTIVFEDNAIRISYPDWDTNLPKPILDSGAPMRVIKSDVPFTQPNGPDERA